MKAKYVREEQVFQPKDPNKLLGEYVNQYVDYNSGAWFENFFRTLQEKGFSYDFLRENKTTILNLVSKSMRKVLNEKIKKITEPTSKYTLRSDVKRENIGYGEMAATTTWELYDSNGKLIKRHEQFSRDDKRFRDWKEFVKSLGINPKEVEKI